MAPASREVQPRPPKTSRPSSKAHLHIERIAAAKSSNPRRKDMADSWATVRRYEGVNDPDEVAKRVRGGFIPLISVFENQTDEEDSNRLAADFVKENLAELLPKPPMVTAGQVRAEG
jgi:hypothetical protein